MQRAVVGGDSSPDGDRCLLDDRFGLMLSLAAILAAQKEKPLKINVFRGPIVDYTFQISNLGLEKDISENVDYCAHNQASTM
jgi:hypothetical protein